MGGTAGSKKLFRWDDVHNKLQILDRPADFFAKCKAVLQVQRHSALRKENQL